MNLSKNNFIIFLIIFILYSGNLFSPAWAESISTLKLDARRIPWTQLTFHAKNFWVEVTTGIQLMLGSASEVEAELLKSPKGSPVRAETMKTAQMTINTIIDPVFRPEVNIHNQVWFDPSNAAALGRIRLRRGDDDFKKIYRFTKQGVFRHRIEPKDKREGRLKPDKWTDIKDTFYPYDLNQRNCPGVSERSILIYILSAAATSKHNTPLKLCVFGKRQLHRVQLRKEGIQPVKINYIEKNQQVETRKEGTLKALKMAITAQPLESHLEDGENFSFLGFHKDIKIYMDPTSGLPIQASGIIPTIGKADLVLEEMRSGQISD